MLDDSGGTCPLQDGDNAQLLLDYCARRLSPSVERSLELHIAECPSCQKFRDQQRAIWNALDVWEHADFSPGFDLRLQEKLEAEARRPVTAKAMDWMQGVSMRPALPLAAAFLLWMVGWQFFKPASDAGQTVPLPDPPAIEQVESTLEDMEMLNQLAPSE